MSVPALADSRILRLAGFAGLYSAQGLPWGLFMIALPTWLAAQGYSTLQVGSFIGTVSLPWTLKLLAGPVMDRFSFLPMGRRRPWVLLAQTGILLGSMVLAMGPNSYFWILAVGFMINFCAAWQDVAVDGMAIDILPEEERAQANAFMFGGQIFGISAASAGGAWLLANYGLSGTAWMMAVSVGAVALIPLLFRERTGERLLPWTRGEASPRSKELQQTGWVGIFTDLVRVLVLPMSLLLIAVKFGDRITAGIFTSVMPVLTTQELGFAETFYPEWSAMAGLAAAVAGVVVAPWIDRMTAVRALFQGLLAKVVIITVVALLVEYWTVPGVVVTFIFAYSLVGQWLTIASISLFMHLCSPRVAASQFAVYMAMSNLALSAGSFFTGLLDLVFSFSQIFYVVAIIDLAMLGLLMSFNLDRHRRTLAQLETRTKIRGSGPIAGGADDG